MSDLLYSPLLQALAKNAIDIPDKVALEEAKRRITYHELFIAIRKTASFLQEKGIQKGDKVILSADKEIDFVFVYFASHMLGAINVVVDPAMRKERLEYIVDITHPKISFGLKTPIKGCLHQEFPLSLSNMPSYKKSGSICNITDTADIMFTTGTTGKPKGVCLSHLNIFSSARNINAFIGNTAEDIEALALPLSHSFGLGRMRCCLLQGTSLVLLGNFANLKLFFEAIEKYQITGFGMVPAVWAYIQKLSGDRISKYSQQIKYIEIGSAAMSIEDKRELLALFPDTRICMHYGLTEASRALFMEFHDKQGCLNTIGAPSSSEVLVKIRDEAGHEVPMGEQGEITVSGDIVMSSYFLPKDNEGMFFGSYFRTGDWGYLGQDGNYYLVSRKKELINIGGKKVSPTEIEEAIQKTGVSECACISVKDPNGILGEVVKAFVVKGKKDISFDEIRSRISGKLEPYKVPVFFEWIKSIPKTSSGKIQRLLLKEHSCLN